MSNRPIAGTTTGASYTRSASFTDPTPTCATTNVGACSITPCRATSSGTGSALPNAGELTFAGAEMTSVVLDPESNGSYMSQTVAQQLAWSTGGEMVTIQWAHLPGDPTQPGGSITLATPPYIALSPGSPLSTTPSVLARAQDMTLSWTSDSPPSVLDQVLVDVWLGSTQVTCAFSAMAGTGIVPAAALQLLDSGQGNYDIHSKESASETLNGASGEQWAVGFNIDAHARTSYGVATGSVTIQ